MRYLGLLAAVLAAAGAQYELQDTFAGASFFENFIFYNSWDPTFGFVHYVDQAFAQQMGMINTTGLGEAAKFGVDTTQYLNPDANLGRLSLRLISEQSWTHGLFIIDLAHMPANVCGTWPAFWALGSGTWPNNGEVDIIEFTNNVSNNLMALHTTEGCTVAGADETGSLLTANCGIDDGITGCTVASTTPNNSGAAFNDNGGGVYAMEWTSTGIQIWSFSRTDIPPSIAAGTPDTDEFGTPSANFQGSCDIDAHFYNMSLIFDIDFCGAWAGSVWQENGCPMLDPEDSWASCNQFVALNPGAYIDSYWEVNYLKIYQTSIGVLPSLTSPVISVTPAISTSAVSTALSNAEGRSTTPTMTLAGTVPTEPVGTFTATSSVLSVLSSLSTKSTAKSTMTTEVATSSITATSTTWPGLQTTPTIVSPAAPPVPTTMSPTISPVPTSVGSPGQSQSTTVPSIATIIPATTKATPASALNCQGNVCVLYTTVVVVQTITAGSVQSPPDKPEMEDRRDLPRREIKPSHEMTGYACTSTRYEIFNGQRWTETFTASTAFTSGQILKFSSYLDIDSNFMETMLTAQLPSPRIYTYTGASFLRHPEWLLPLLLHVHLWPTLHAFDRNRPAHRRLWRETVGLHTDDGILSTETQVDARCSLRGTEERRIDLVGIQKAAATNADHSPQSSLDNLSVIVEGSFEALI